MLLPPAPPQGGAGRQPGLAVAVALRGGGGGVARHNRHFKAVGFDSPVWGSHMGRTLYLSSILY